MDEANYLPDVKAQYELLPYPPVDPQDELKRLQGTWTEQLEMISYYCFQGKADFRRGFRALVAGGGTGDATIYLAEQLRHTDARIVHLDLSLPSIRIAQQRAALRGLHNIEWVQDSLLNIPALGLGQFDYINCSGVLHHLADPDAGIVALKSALKPGGAMGIMVYGAIGRTGVYQVQHLLRLANVGPDPAARIAHAREVLAALPPTNWLKRSEEIFGHEYMSSDAGLYDLLLHSQDRAYTVSELFEWLADQHGFHIELTDVQRGRFPYLPGMTLGPDAPRARALLAAMEPRAQYAMAELFMGDLITHSFYLTDSPQARAPYGDVAYVPFMFHEKLPPEALAQVLTPETQGQRVTLHHPALGLTVQIDPGRYSARIAGLIDGERSFGQIFDLVRADPALRAERPDNAALFADFKESFDTLNAIERILLRHVDTRIARHG